MSILEVKFKNDRVFLLKEHGITLHDYEKQLSKIDYNSVYEKYKELKDENGAEKEKFPPVNIVFYSHLFEYKRVPDTYELLMEYFEEYKNDFLTNYDDNFVSYNGHTYSIDAVKARILRTYPSLIRDFHFYLMLIEDGSFDEIIYSCLSDIEGKDIIIKHNGNKYIVSLYVNTKRSGFFKNIKNRYRHSYPNDEIKIPLNFSTATKCGDFYLYGSKEIKMIKDKIV